MYTVRRIPGRGPRWWIVEVATGKAKMGPFDSQTRAAGICCGPLYNALADLPAPTAPARVK